MGVRQIRYCDITGVEKDVEGHVLNVDQMRIELDLAAPEYQKLLAVLRPYIDAGRVEASVPESVVAAMTKSGRRSPRVSASSSTGLTPEERAQVRTWAEARGIEVPANNRFKSALVEEWRRETGPA
ncbi:MAG: Lsr2 family protein [Pseudonocardia sp.]|nr:Lsr2 family protein [Pseudonocardia sp.]